MSHKPDAELQTWFKVSRHSTRVEPVEVSRSTDNSVWINGRRKPRNGSYAQYLPNQGDALDRIYERLQRDVSRAERNLNDAKSRLGTFKKNLATPAIAEAGGEGGA